MNRTKLCLFAILALAATSRFWGLWYGLPILYTGDEGQFIPQAVRFGSGDLNPHNFLYPTLYKYLLFVSYGIYFVVGKVVGIFASASDFKIRYFTDPSDFYAIGRMLSAMFGSLTVWVVFLIGRTVRNESSGLIAALLLAVDHLHLRFSHLAKPDVTMTFLFMVAVYFACRIYKDGRLRDYVACSAFTGLAISTKYNAVFMILAIALAHFLRTQSIKATWQDRLGYLSLAGFVVVLFFFAGSPYALLDFQTFVKDVKFQNFAISGEQSLAGFVTTAHIYLKTLFLPSFLAWDANYWGLIVLVGIFWSLYKIDRGELILLVLIGVQFFYIAYKTSPSFVKPHFVMPLIPLAYFFAAKVIAQLRETLKLSAQRSVVLYGSALLLIAPVKHMALVDYQRSQEDTGRSAREWVEENLPDGSRLLYAGTQGLALMETQDSLVRKEDDNADAIQPAKLQAIKNYLGPKYEIYELHHGWSYIPQEKLDEIEHVPEGMMLLESQRLSLPFWRDRKIDYVIVTATKAGIEDYLSRQSAAIQSFFASLEAEGIQVKEFIPDPPKRPGVHIRIYKLEPQA